MSSLSSLVSRLHTDILDSCSLIDLDRFIRVCANLVPEIKLHIPHGSSKAPHRLPAYIQALLVEVLRLDSLLVSQLWDSLKDDLWSNTLGYHNKALTDKEKDAVDRAGTKPTTHKNERIECKMRYYPTYYTDNGLRHFYTNVSKVIHIEEHAFIESELCELFTSFMLFAWVSSQNCANIINAALTRLQSSLESTATGSSSLSELTLSSEQIFRAFILNGLLRDSNEQGKPLILPDIGDHDDRLKVTMQIRNERIMTKGFKERMHACSKCEHFIEGTGYNNLRALRACVTDGITLGRPCCKVHNCTEPLINNRAHFCQTHKSLKCIFVVKDCTRKANEGFQTCSQAEHRELEDCRKEHGKAFFQLRKRLNEFNSSQLPNSIAALDSEVEMIPEERYDVDHDYSKKSDEGNVVPKARFARRRTHNEQLIVSCCGVINARATMFGAESISGVKLFPKSVYPNRLDCPNVMFYDDNCQVQAHLAAQKDSYFEHVIMPVDVFHFKSKHKITDEFCQKHCNPAKWHELVGKDGKWVFNSSAAEQVNAWLGGYLAIVRDMLAHNYDFFLDEMIIRRNKLVLARLTEAGHIPYDVPLYDDYPQ